MASGDGDSYVASPTLFRLDDDDGYEDLLGTQFPTGNPDLPLLDLDVDFPIEEVEQPVQRAHVPPSQPIREVEVTKALPQNVRARIPDNIDVIDLDSLGFDGLNSGLACRELRIPIKTEDQDVVLLSSDTTAIIKSEPEMVSSWTAMPKHIDLIDSDEEPEDTVRIISANPIAIKQEDEEGWTWAEMEREVIELSDAEGEVVAKQPLNSSPIQDSNRAVPSEAAPAPALSSTSMLRASNIKTKRTPADHARLLQIQKMYAERALGKTVVVGAGGIFKGAQSSAENANTNRMAIDVGVVDDELAWMNNGVDPNDDADAAVKFAETKTRYNRKKRAGRNTFEDDILFMKAESAENSRLKRLDDDYQRARGPVYSEDVEEILSDDELFVRQSPLPSLKRPHAATVESDNDEDNNNAIIVESDPDESDPNAYKTRKPQSKKQRAKELETELQNSMMAGIEMEMAREKKKAGRKSRAPQKDLGKDQSNHRVRKGKSQGSRSKAKKFKLKKTKSKNTKKPRPTQKGYLNDFGSLFTSNVYEDANANLDRPPLTPTDTRVKDQALKSLLASVPLEDLKTARAEKQHVIRATKTLGARKVKADGKGGWKFKGMTTSLYNHQVQGAAWMRERETGDVEPLGGLQADEMGLGKTVMTIACMISNPPASGTSRCTLIVCTPALITQWESEIRKHTEPKVFTTILKYHGREFTRIYGRDAESQVQNADIVITSYQEVLKSYPRYQPPKEIMLPEKRKEWWTAEYEKNRAILHRVHFHRIVLDEAQIIKNHLSQISIACRGLMGKHRWAISGTPIQNRVNEFFPFFKFLRVRHTGTFEVFKENFADPDNDDANDRLHSFLKQFMIRRTHRNTLFGRALVKMPKTTQKTIMLEFNQVERAIYEAVRTRYIRKINRNSRDGVLEKCYSNVLTMLLRLRQLTAHPFMLQKTIEDLFELEDIEKLWGLTSPEVTADENPARNMLLTMKNMIAEKDKPVEIAQTGCTDSTPVDSPADDLPPGEFGTLIFKFRRFLRDLAQSRKWEDLKNRSLCHKCRDPPDEPWVTSCLHVYCKECLNALAYEAAKEDREEAFCLECGIIYNESRPCNGLKELQMDAEGNGMASPEASQTRVRKDPEHDLKWINFNGAILPSTKTAAVQAQIELWLQEEPDKKIIVFSQFRMLMKVLGRLFQQRGWTFVNYHGEMSHEARDAAISSFRDNTDTKLMIASLKCGGVGLNLTMASRVICVDLWWNSSVEQQAFCRVFRIGQESETFITRLVVKNTVDEKLQAMQDSKEEAIGAAIDDSKMLDKLSLTDLMRLFGPVQIGEDRKPFIMVEDEAEFDSIIPPIL